MKIDRELQRAILTLLNDAYPESVIDPGFHLANQGYGDRTHTIANLMYLNDHGLVEVKALRGMQTTHIGGAQITHRGIDFLADDGGIGAVLNVLTVKLHADTVRELLVAKVQANLTATHEERSELAAQIRTLPAKALGKLTESLLSKGVDYAVQSLPQLGTLIGQALGS